MRTQADIQEELDAVNSAIKKLIADGVAFVSRSGRTVTYHDLDKLRALRKELEERLAAIEGRDARSFVQFDRPGGAV